jgi:dihydroxyacetone kinase phosphotransfer subunit
MPTLPTHEARVLSEGAVLPGDAMLPETAASGTAAVPETATVPRQGPGRSVFVGIVLVSHSALLAEGAAELVRQLAGEDVPVEPAGGLPDGGLGTSSELIEQAVRVADRGAGVLLLADLGSAVLTVRLLLDDADPGDRLAAAQLADAPLVEGAVSAAVAAAAGADLRAVCAAAEEARGFKKL